MIRFPIRNFSSLISNVGIVGSGQMGTGIAYVLNRHANKKVYVYDNHKPQLEKSQAFIKKLIEKEISKSTLTQEEAKKVENNFTFTDNISHMSNVQFIVEAVKEDFEVKRQIFQSLEKITDKNTILASNTSSISITKLAGTVERPDKVIGMHFMNPVPIMKLVEVIKGLSTSDQTFDVTMDLIQQSKKTSAVSNDIPGFIVNRILMPMINEAVYTLYEGIASKEDIDKAMVLGTNVPMGPLTLADFIGLDTCLYILNVLYSELKDPK